MKIQNARVMIHTFDQYAIEANKFLEKLAKDLNCSQDLPKAKRVLRAVLHTLRDRITIPESFQMLAQLPTLLKGIYVEDWKYRERPLKFRTKETLLQALIESEHLVTPDDFPNEEYAIFAVRMVLRNLTAYVSNGEFEDVLAQLPEEIRTAVSLN